MTTSITLPLPAGGHLAGSLDLDPGRGQQHAVVYVHGFGSERGGAKAAALRDACRRRGWNFAAFDFRGHGGSSGTMLDLRASGLQDDLEAVRDFLAPQGISKLLLVGSSMGGFASAWFSVLHPHSAAALVLVAPAFRFLEARWANLDEADRQEWRRVGKGRFKNEFVDVELSYALVEEQDRFRWQDLADRWRAPALIFHGMRDESVPYQHSVELADRAAFTGIEVRLLRGGDHRLTAEREALAEEACRFFAAHV